MESPRVLQARAALIDARAMAKASTEGRAQWVLPLRLAAELLPARPPAIRDDPGALTRHKLGIKVNHADPSFPAVHGTGPRMRTSIPTLSPAAPIPTVWVPPETPVCDVCYTKCLHFRPEGPSTSRREKEKNSRRRRRRKTHPSSVATARRVETQVFSNLPRAEIVVFARVESDEATCRREIEAEEAEDWERMMLQFRLELSSVAAVCLRRYGNAAIHAAVASRRAADAAERERQELLRRFDNTKLALADLKKKDFDEVKSFARPPQGVALAMTSALVLIGEGEAVQRGSAMPWEAIRKVLIRVDVLKRLRAMAAAELTSAVLEQLGAFVADANFAPGAVDKISIACVAMVRFVAALHEFRTDAAKLAMLAEIIQRHRGNHDEQVSALSNDELEAMQAIEAEASVSQY